MANCRGLAKLTLTPLLNRSIEITKGITRNFLNKMLLFQKQMSRKFRVPLPVFHCAGRCITKVQISFHNGPPVGFIFFSIIIFFKINVIPRHI